MPMGQLLLVSNLKLHITCTRTRHNNIIKTCDGVTRHRDEAVFNYRGRVNEKKKNNTKKWIIIYLLFETRRSNRDQWPYGYQWMRSRRVRPETIIMILSSSSSSSLDRCHRLRRRHRRRQGGLFIVLAFSGGKKNVIPTDLRPFARRVVAV